MKISLKAARVNAGLTQKDLEIKTNKNPQTILNWENGNTQIPLKEFKLICKILNVDEDKISLPIKSILSWYMIINIRLITKIGRRKDENF